MGWSTEVFDVHETPFTIFTDFGPKTPLAPDRLRLTQVSLYPVQHFPIIVICLFHLNHLNSEINPDRLGEITRFKTEV